MNSTEIWKDIEGFEGLYQVSNMGRVRSLERVDAQGRRLKGKV
ncbi:NUMOD4 domain-containing protein, partial [Lacticaseibacillus paracasei]